MWYAFRVVGKDVARLGATPVCSRSSGTCAMPALVASRGSPPRNVRPSTATEPRAGGRRPVTASAPFHAVIAGGVAVLLAIAVLLAGNPRWERLTAPFMLWAPVATPLLVVGEAIRRAFELVGLVGTPRYRPLLRGGFFALPVVGLFTLILVNADPPIVVPDRHQLPVAGVRQGRKQQSFHHAENRRVGANAERERQQHNEREAGILAHPAPRELDVLPDWAHLPRSHRDFVTQLKPQVRIDQRQ